MEVLQAKDLKKIYGSGNNAVHALDGVDLSVKKGEFVAIVGTSGSGNPRCCTCWAGWIALQAVRSWWTDRIFSP